MDISVRNKLCTSNHIHTLMGLNLGIVPDAFCTALRMETSSLWCEEVNCVSFKPKYLLVESRRSHTHMLIFMCVLFALQREDYCRFTRVGNNEQTHPRDTCSISITMKHC